ncbi:MAG: deoxyguanosinetriphosphate triphosphohydrolase [Candidatus Omnitrophica bacterium]|nr:deoxyguanosinetriphosphate triphosphohydrolase [Candidatus Omnitrophota bacterium]
MLTREMLEKYEQENLADYAMKSSQTKGRVYFEKEHDYRSVYQRDRDRIIHSTAFRRLEYKTQVFVNPEADYYRTRLTHTLEVAQIARSVAKTLRLNEELTETIALAHDLGHTPFGHAGEEVLNEMMKGHGGFEHNRHGLRVVDELEKRYPDFDGLNLSCEVREGILKHKSTFDAPQDQEKKFPDPQPVLEAQIVDLADEIAYDNHDLDDGLTSGAFNEKDLKKIKLWTKVEAIVKEKYPDLSSKLKKYQIVRFLINAEVTDLIINSEKRISELDVTSVAQVKQLPDKVVGFSANMHKDMEQLRKFLMENLYKHYRIVRMTNKAKRFIKELFAVYLSKPKQLPPTAQQTVKDGNWHRVICDYIAGMTDRYCLDEYKKLFDPYERV